MNTIVRVAGLLGQSSVRFVLDSGAAVSVVDYGVVEKPYGDLIQKEGVTTAVGANGLPLNVVGKVHLPVKLGNFQQDQEFLVAKNLSVECLLGADFLVRSEAILDCKAGRLSLKGAVVPITMGSSMTPSDTPVMSVQVTETVEVPPRSVMLIQATVKGKGCNGLVHEGFLEPSYSSNFPKHVLVARSLSEVGQDQKVVAQVMNISPDTVKLYKGMKVGELTPRQHVQVVGEQEPDIPSPIPESAEVDLTKKPGI